MEHISINIFINSLITSKLSNSSRRGVSVGRTLVRGTPLTIVANQYLAIPFGLINQTNRAQAMDKLTTITNSGRKKISLCPSSRVLAEGQDKRKKCLQSFEEPNYKLGILFPVSYFGKREKGSSPAPPSSYSRRGPEQH